MIHKTLTMIIIHREKKNKLINKHDSTEFENFELWTQLSLSKLVIIQITLQLAFAGIKILFLSHNACGIEVTDKINSL